MSKKGPWHHIGNAVNQRDTMSVPPRRKLINWLVVIAILAIGIWAYWMVMA